MTRKELLTVNQTIVALSFGTRRHDVPEAEHDTDTSIRFVIVSLKPTSDDRRFRPTQNVCSDTHTLMATILEEHSQHKIHKVLSTYVVVSMKGIIVGPSVCFKETLHTRLPYLAESEFLAVPVVIESAFPVGYDI